MTPRASSSRPMSDEPLCASRTSMHDAAAVGRQLRISITAGASDDAESPAAAIDPRQLR